MEDLWAIIVFVLTLMLKLPIKKTTIKFEETKRKAVNTTIILIPVVLSALICSVSSGLYFGEWFSEKVIQNAVSVYLLSFAIYSIFSRIKIVIVGIKSGKIKTACLMVGIVLTLFNNLPFELCNIAVAKVLLFIATILSIVSGVQYYSLNKNLIKDK